MVYTSGDVNGTLNLNILEETSGSATITVTVQDDGGTANGGVDMVTTSFTLTLDFGTTPSPSSINENKSELIKIYPVPAANILTVVTKDMINSFNIFDLSGKVLMTNTTVSDKVMNIPVYDLNKGSYILQVETSKGTLLKSFIKQ